MFRCGLQFMPILLRVIPSFQQKKPLDFFKEKSNSDELRFDFVPQDKVDLIRKQKKGDKSKFALALEKEVYKGLESELLIPVETRLGVDRVEFIKQVFSCSKSPALFFQNCRSSSNTTWCQKNARRKCGELRETLSTIASEEQGRSFAKQANLAPLAEAPKERAVTALLRLAA